MTRVAIGFAALMVLTAPTARAQIRAFKFYGPNTAYSAEDGDIGGGYYAVDPTLLPYDTWWTKVGWQYQFNAKWDISGFPGAIDDSLSDFYAPHLLRGSYVKAINNQVPEHWSEPFDPNDKGDTGTGYIRLESFMNVYFNWGPPVSEGQTLGSYIGSHSIDFIAGGGRYTVIEDPTVEQFTIQDIFQNEKTRSSLKDNMTVANGKVTTAFKPYVSVGGYDMQVPLDLVAQLFGVDHFNWRQTETVNPDDFQIQVDIDGDKSTTQDRIDGPPQHIDPIQNTTSRYLLTSKNPAVHPNLREVMITVQEPPDTLLYLWNEGVGSKLEVSNPKITEAFALNFEDTPSLPLWYDQDLNPLPHVREVREYFTELVGVKSDGSYVDTPFPLWFSWKSDAKYYILPDIVITGGAEIVGYSYTYDDGSLPAVFVGGVFDIEFSTSSTGVPEPSTLILLLLGAAGLFAFARRRRKR